MDKHRMINTKFWSDSYISDLDPIEKLLYLYLITNERTNICGAYELPLKYMSVETGIEKEMIQKILSRFEEDNKVWYRDGYVFVRNFVKNQKTESPTIQKSIEKNTAKLPAQIRGIMEGIDRVSIGYQYGMDKRKTEKGKLKTEKGKDKAENSYEVQASLETKNDVNEIIKLFYEINPSLDFGRKPERDASSSLIKKYGFNESKRMVEYTISIQGQPYAPVVTSPAEMWKKLAKIAIFAKGNQSKIIDIPA